MIRSYKNIALIAQIFILFAFLAKGLIPAGFMPARANAHELFPLVVCSSEGTATVFVKADQLPVAPEKDSGKEHGHELPCAFAAVFGTGVLPDAVVLAVFAVHGSAIDIIHDASIVWKKPVSYFSRGPPLNNF